ncbi:MAG: YhcN/YlaJ family sporulation lipoprotein [Clostridia bacterium]|nr:YhcN/YlaJ family sporulation lipoprotein [Clostridia bacterium]
MKTKFLTSIMLALGLVVGIAVCPAVFAQELDTPKTLHEKIERQLNTINGIKESRVFIYNDVALVALRTQNLTNKTQTEEAKNTVKEFFAKNYPNVTNLKISCSIKLFVAIEQLNRLVESNGDANIDDILEKIPSIFPRPMPKPMPER